MIAKSWRVLTARGKTFLALGLLGLIACMVLGQRDLARVFVLLVLLPLAAIGVVGRSRLHLVSERTIDPPRVTLGERMDATLSLRKAGSLPVGLLRFEDTVPRELGRRPRFTIHTFAGDWKRRISYPLMGLARGRYRVGPLLVRAVDPFGLAQIDRQFRASNEVLVTPEVVPLSQLGSAAGNNASGESTPQKIGLVGQDDVLVREYRDGDDVRRIHWRSTAKKGEIMVRREEQAWDPSVTVLLDSRASSHAGTGRTASFEWAVSAATSVAHHLISNGFRLIMVDSEGLVPTASAEDPYAAREAVLLAMTDEQLSDLETLEGALEGNLQRQGEMLVAILGRLTPADVTALATARRGRTVGLAIVLDVDSFTIRGLRAEPELIAQHEECCRQLADAQWRVVQVKRGSSVAEAWAELERRGGGA
ncbi:MULTISPECIES: DUF58 domain-containing protein [unclassified Luteococcus]|uniref:DUF58 domain-containing protein n=1 Tax=unclassified Luteococcus TaxID=2639923 RepID=UPI00313C7347